MMNDNGPDITVVMPMRNGEDFVAEALRTVLEQDGVDLEVVVVDDGSTDRSRTIVERFRDPRIRIIDGPGEGVAGSCNAGFKAARGSVVVRCDADDLYPPGRLVWQWRWLEAHPQFGAVCGGYRTMNANGRISTPMDCGDEAMEITQEFAKGITRTHMCTFAIRAEVLRSIDGCRPFFITSSDVDLQLRFGQACRVWYEPVDCYAYRLHDKSITHTKKSIVRLYYDTMARTLAKQRGRRGTDDLDEGKTIPPPEEDQSLPLRAADQMQEILRGMSWRYHHRGNRIKALKLGVRACWVNPAKPSIWKSLLALALKRPRAATVKPDQPMQAPHERAAG